MTDLPILPEDEDEDDALAAEYVLGVQDADERTGLEARIRRDATFARRVAEWEARLGGLNGGFADVPAPNLLPAIEARLFGTAPAATRRRPLQWLFGAGLAAALAVLAFVMLTPPPALPLVATLAAEDQALVYAARYDKAAGEIVLTRTSGQAAGNEQVHELWLIEGDAAPVSLGLLPDSEVRLSHAALTPGAVLAVSLEPAGGSPTGQPTGPVLVTGKVENL